MRSRARALGTTRTRNHMSEKGAFPFRFRHQIAWRLRTRMHSPIALCVCANVLRLFGATRDQTHHQMVLYLRTIHDGTRTSQLTPYCTRAARSQSLPRCRRCSHQNARAARRDCTFAVREKAQQRQNMPDGGCVGAPDPFGGGGGRLRASASGRVRERERARRRRRRRKGGQRRVGRDGRRAERRSGGRARGGRGTGRGGRASGRRSGSARIAAGRTGPRAAAALPPAQSRARARAATPPAALEPQNREPARSAHNANANANQR